MMHRQQMCSFGPGVKRRMDDLNFEFLDDAFGAEKLAGNEYLHLSAAMVFHDHDYVLGVQLAVGE